MKNLEIIEKLALKASTEQPPVFEVSRKVMQKINFRISADEQNSATIISLPVLSSISAAAMVLIIIYSVNIWPKIMNTLMWSDPAIRSLMNF